LFPKLGGLAFSPFPFREGGRGVRSCLAESLVCDVGIVMLTSIAAAPTPRHVVNDTQAGSQFHFRWESPAWKPLFLTVGVLDRSNRSALERIVGHAHV
jgi:hypothetical protein